MPRHPWTAPKPSRDGNCIECRQPLTGRRHYFCTDECDKAWKLRHVWGTLRRHILERDGFSCQSCGAEGRHESRIGGSRYSLEVDHIVEIMDGGAEFDPANLQTLCGDCHKAKTKASWASRGVKPVGESLQLPLEGMGA